MQSRPETIKSPAVSATDQADIVAQESHEILVQRWDEENQQPALQQLKKQMKPKNDILAQAAMKAGIPLDISSDSESDGDPVQTSTPISTMNNPDIEPDI